MFKKSHSWTKACWRNFSLSLSLAIEMMFNNTVLVATRQTMWIIHSAFPSKSPIIYTVSIYPYWGIGMDDGMCVG
jgi:hypothetical protein